MTRLAVDLSLAKKYGRPGPRYTSYPPAPHFSADLPKETLHAAFDAAAVPPFSLYFHIPFCESLCWFCGCNNLIRTHRGTAGDYLGLLEREMDLKARWRSAGRAATQLHWGGGSPSFLLPEEITRLGRAIRSRFDIAPNAECAVELDPRDITPEHVPALAEAGFNRASLGVQDNDLKVQKAVNRVQSPELTASLVSDLRAHGFRSVNLDLIYGLPYQTVESFARTLADVLSLSPDRLAVFNYAHVPWMKPQQKILPESAMPTPEMRLELLKLSVETLTGAGYVYIGMDHFARPEDELVRAQRSGTLIRNFQGYSAFAGSTILGFGMSSISQCDAAYAQNLRGLAEYTAAIQAGALPTEKGYILTGEDRLRRTVIMTLMCNLVLDADALSSKLGLDIRAHFAPEWERLAPFAEDGLVELTPRGISVTETGRLFVRNIAMVIDAHLGEGPGRYSRTV